MSALLALALALCGPARAQEKEAYEAKPGLIPAGGILLFYDSVGPLSFETLAPSQVPPGSRPLGELRARSCQYGLSIPLALSLRSLSLSGAGGNGGYRKALERLKRERPEAAGLFDVKVDLRLTSVLGIFRRLCTEVSGRGFARG